MPQTIDGCNELLDQLSEAYSREYENGASDAVLNGISDTITNVKLHRLFLKCKEETCEPTPG